LGRNVICNLTVLVIIDADFSKLNFVNRYMEEKGANAPGSVSLTSGLSKPFRRLERYPNILRELERHIMASNF